MVYFIHLFIFINQTQKKKKDEIKALNKSSNDDISTLDDYILFIKYDFKIKSYFKMKILSAYQKD